LERGKVSKLFKAKKVAHRPPTALSEDLFRAISAAAMTRLMEDRRLSRDEAARDIARRLSGIGAKHSSGKAITFRQIAKWREKVTAELASENQAAARYDMRLPACPANGGRDGVLRRGNADAGLLDRSVAGQFSLIIRLVAALERVHQHQASPGFSTRAHSPKMMRRTAGGNSWNMKMLERRAAAGRQLRPAAASSYLDSPGLISNCFASVVGQVPRD
jgi:hypothetical protein